MKYLRYMGEFASREGVRWRVEVMQEADEAFPQVGRLLFPAEQPLVLEWAQKSKEEVVCGSTATLQIISPGDRTYTDLYSIDPCRVRLDVYREGALYWSGCLDTEFYEEPYEQHDGYDVTLTFSDFGVMDRLAWEGEGLMTLEEAVTCCLGRSAVNYTALDQSMISTALPAAPGAMNLADIMVRSDNFYDEDGEASTLQEVLEAVLQPLALRIVQRQGKVWVYDLNGLCTLGTDTPIRWAGDSQTLGADTVYNNAKVTWSTYAQSGNLCPTECWAEDIPTDPNLTALDSLKGIEKGDATYFSYHLSSDFDDWGKGHDASGFTLWTATRGRNVETHTDMDFFKLVPQEDGEEAEGIALRWCTAAKEAGDTLNMTYHGYRMSMPGQWGHIGSPLYSTGSIWLPHVNEVQKDLLTREVPQQIRITMDMLLDVRHNPFEDAARLTRQENEKDAYELMKEYGNFVYVPVSIRFQPDGEDTVYVWDNRRCIEGSASVNRLINTYGKWVSQDEEVAWGYLCYRDAKDYDEESGCLGWKRNRPAIPPLWSMFSGVKPGVNLGQEGQIIPYPNFGTRGGRLWIDFHGQGWYMAEGRKELQTGTDYRFTDAANGKKSLWSKIRWVLLRLPEIEVVNTGEYDRTVSTDDVEYSATLNAAAKESIELDTMCGTAADGVPMARGAYFDASLGTQLTRLSRAGRTTQAEDLLIGTLYSQFARRHITLTGEADILASGLCTYTEQCQGSLRFICAEDVQDLQQDTSEALFIELSPDHYKRDNEE